MEIKKFSKNAQAYGEFNGGEIIENKPIGFPQDGGSMRPYSNLFYWANAIAKKESTIGLHPHKGFEIMSFVLEGNIRHFDTKLNSWKSLEAGDVQIIRAGNGISHAEHMGENARMFQIWFDPDLEKTLEMEASYDDFKAADFMMVEENGMHLTQYSAKSGPLHMESNVKILRAKFEAGNHVIPVPENHVSSIYVLDGQVDIYSESGTKDDFFQLTNAEQIDVHGQGELFVIQSPKVLPYRTYGEMMRR